MADAGYLSIFKQRGASAALKQKVTGGQQHVEQLSLLNVGWASSKK